ncbi:very long chain fatty acid elongase 4-like [Aphomia sociella]
MRKVIGYLDTLQRIQPRLKKKELATQQPYNFVDKWFLMESPIPILTTWVMYLLFVLKIGPETMKKRQAFDLRNVIILYNVVQVITSFMLLKMGISLLRPVGYVHITCVHDDGTKRNIAWGIYCYFLGKLSELLDTVFFVLRKKQNQVSFLHVYHHSLMLWCSWFILKLEPSYSTVFLGTLNSFVHVVMYTYYGLSAYPSLTKYLWWKKYITSLQLTQFFMVVVHTLANCVFTDCPPSYILLYVIVLNSLFFIYLFGDFYVKSYNSKELKKTNKTSYINGENKTGQNGTILTSCGKIENKTH